MAAERSCQVPSGRLKCSGLVESQRTVTTVPSESDHDGYAPVVVQERVRPHARLDDPRGVVQGAEHVRLG